MSWETPDIRKLIEQLKAIREATMAANAGAFAVPLGRPLRAPSLVGAQDNYDPEEYGRNYSTKKKRKTRK